jgi:hypothetical protein
MIYINVMSVLLMNVTKTKNKRQRHGSFVNGFKSA